MSSIGTAQLTLRLSPQDYGARMEDPQARGEVITFYSYKGGTGRTMALANCAAILTQRRFPEQKPILMIDFDLEAPGLHRYLAPYLPTVSGPDNTPGTIEMFSEISASVDSALAAQRTNDLNIDVLDDATVAKIIDRLDIAPYVRNCTSELPSAYLMTAGRFDKTYDARIQSFHWKELFDRAPGLFKALAARFALEYSFVFIDARTGLSDVSNVCSVLLPDVLAVVFTPNRQSLAGVGHLVEQARRYRVASSETRPLRVYPLASRVDVQNEQFREVWRRGARGHPIFGDVEGYQQIFEGIFINELNEPEPRNRFDHYLEQVQAPHTTDYAYGERLTVMQGASQDSLSLYRCYDVMLQWLASGAQPWQVPSTAILELRAQKLLERLAPPESVKERPNWAAMLERSTDALRELLQTAAELSPALAGALGTMCALSYLAQGRPVSANEVLPHAVAPNDLADLQIAAANVVEQRRAAWSRADNTALANDAVFARLEDLLLKKSAANVVKPPRDLLSERALLIAFAGLALDVGRVSRATRLWRQVVSVCVEAFGGEHPNTLTSMNNLASTLRSQGDLAGARVLEEQALAASRRVLGEEHPDTLTSMNNLAATLRSQGDLPGARVLEEQALAASRRSVGEEHPDALTSMNNLAQTLKAQGDLPGARGLEEQALAVRRRLQGEEHPDTLTSMNNLAETLKAQGDLAGARVLEEQALAARRRVLGEEHPETLTSMNNLAGTFKAQGDLPGARVLEEQALAARRRVLGEEHPDTLTSMNNLAGTLRSQGDLAGARVLQEQSLATSRRLLGEEHPDTLTSMNNLAGTLYVQGDLERARVLQEQALAASRRVLGEAHPHTLASANNLAQTLRKLGAHSEALNLLQVSVDRGAAHSEAVKVAERLMARWQIEDGNATGATTVLDRLLIESTGESWREAAMLRMRAAKDVGDIEMMGSLLEQLESESKKTGS